MLISSGLQGLMYMYIWAVQGESLQDRTVNPSDALRYLLTRLYLTLL